MSPRAWAVTALVVLFAAVAAFAAAKIPWHRAPAPRADQLDALSRLDAEQVERARDFHGELRPGRYAAMAIGLSMAAVLGLTPIGARLVSAVGDHWLVQAVFGGLLVVLVTELVTLPIAIWRHTVVVRYGISTQSWSGWAVDMLKSYAVGAVLGGLVLAGFFTITHFAPDWWWAFASAGVAGLVVLLSFVLPVLVEPIFNKFTPMAEGPLRTELLALAERDGVPVRDVLVADASRRTRAVNAYVSGLGPTRRIVVYDTMLTEATPDEVVSVTAHELGHAKDNDVLTGTVIGALGAAASVIVLYLIGSWGGLLRLADVESIGEPRAIGLLLVLTTIAGLVAGPAQAFVSRRVEARADTHALDLTGDPETFEAMQRRLGTVNLSDPDPPHWEHAMFASHPSTVQRMAAARAYARGAR
ncbi:STE24 endopeptidase [Actinoplanes lutulentus]|uniref:STE24 endopeptidase n=1 Tax=Actinoplanes lutulentus TaxID=1287878 RepID=A0A327ZG41_9ACTN|nr:M48 family metallopeptidase [Actinoplanes lutulentus]MBB2941708.1 STE24 endopeptidase [Actinoplanes lutulentus]RAK39628.1 STE24 endopeptidase [Actinoplanes lutulentus]